MLAFLNQHFNNTTLPVIYLQWRGGASHFLLRLCAKLRRDYLPPPTIFISSKEVLENTNIRMDEEWFLARNYSIRMPFPCLAIPALQSDVACKVL